MLFEFKGVSKKCISCKNMLILMLMTLHYQVLRQTEEVARLESNKCVFLSAAEHWWRELSVMLETCFVWLITEIFSLLSASVEDN